MPGTSPTREFGKRRPDPLPTKEPIKRSGHVALLVMGTIAVGTTAYALMPRQDCDPPAAGTAAPAQAGTACTSRSSSGGSGGGRRYSFYGSDSSSHSSPGMSSDAGGGVTRGGFGSFAHAFGFSGHGS